MRALVTGATGFVGSHLVERLVADGTAVAVLARPGSDDRRVARWRPAMTWIGADPLDLEPARGPIADFAPEVVFHLGWGGVGRSVRDDRLQIDANLAGTLAVFDLAAEVGCRAFVGLGSQAEYGPRDDVIDEATPLAPTTLYGAAKASAGLLLGRLAAAAGVRFAWLRLFSAYGPGDRPESLICGLIRTLYAGQTPRLSSGTQLWDYLYVADAAEAIARAGASETASGSFNLASGRAETIRSVAERVRELIDPSALLEFGDLAPAIGMRADVSRLSAAIGWTPRIELPEGLERTVGWYRRSSEIKRSA